VIAEQLNSQKEIALRANNLAGLLLAVAAQPPAARPAPFQGRDLLAEAAALAERALAIKESIGDPSLEIWKNYQRMADIAERRGQGEAARAWRRKARASFAAFPGAWAQIKQYEPVILQAAAAAQGDRAAKQWLDGEFTKMAAGGEAWERAATAIRRIVGGERDLDSLTDELSYLQASVVERILGVLAGEPAPFAQPSAPASTSAPAEAEGDGFTLEQLFGFVAAACQGDAQARQMAPLLVQSMQQPAAPPELRALGGVFARILAGERDPGLAADLPGELQQAVIALLGALK
jgi:hypothetical protein